MFLVVTIAYAGVWLALAMLLSIMFRSAATAALVALGIWLFLALLWPALAPVIAQVIAPPDPRYALLGLPTPDDRAAARTCAVVAERSYSAKSVLAMLSPTTRALGPMFLEQLQGAVIGAPLPLRQSMMIAWPQIVGLIACTIVLFVRLHGVPAPGGAGVI